MTQPRGFVRASSVRLSLVETLLLLGRVRGSFCCSLILRWSNGNPTSKDGFTTSQTLNFEQPERLGFKLTWILSVSRKIDSAFALWVYVNTWQPS